MIYQQLEWDLLCAKTLIVLDEELVIGGEINVAWQKKMESLKNLNNEGKIFKINPKLITMFILIILTLYVQFQNDFTQVSSWNHHRLLWLIQLLRTNPKTDHSYLKHISFMYCAMQPCLQT